MTHRIARAAGLAAIPLFALAGCTSTQVVSRAPARGGAIPQRPVAAAPVPPQRISQPKYGATVVVEKGNTVYHIATTNGITPLDLALWNDIPPPYIIHPGQRLRLYPRDSRTPPPPPVQRPVASTPSAPSATRPVPAPPTNGNLAWRWPTDGQVLSTYLAGEPTRQGLDIGGNAGQPVRAASDGVVVYSGAGLVGYGELVIIKHSNEWLSAYGHNRKRLVTEGQKVAAGQQIAEMGRTAAPRDMLHFEIRYDGKPVDPMQYLPAK